MTEGVKRWRPGRGEQDRMRSAPLGLREREEESAESHWGLAYGKGIFNN